MQLSDVIIRSTKPAEKTLKLADGKGLFLLVQPNGARWWRIRYFVNLVEKNLSLGVYPDVSLKQARERREKLRQLVADGIDPGSVRKAEKRAMAHTFEAIAREWHQKRVATWSPYYGTQMMHRMEKNLFPWIGSTAVNKLTAADFLDCLQRMEKRGPHSKKKERGPEADRRGSATERWLSYSRSQKPR